MNSYNDDKIHRFIITYHYDNTKDIAVKTL